MSIYANNSDSYWRERGQKRHKQSPLVFAGSILLLLLAAIGAILHRKHSSPLTQRRAQDQTDERHWKQCESRVTSRQECTAICQPERNSVQRNTMHQACLHGCQQAHVASTALACRGKIASEEEVFQEIGGLAYIHCNKFQSTDPKPDAFATCRKYHRAGTKQGFRKGLESMSAVLDEEWAGILNDRTLTAEQ